MKHLYTVPAKLLAVLLFVLLLAVCIATGGALIYMADQGYYASGTADYYNTAAPSRLTGNDAYRVYNDWERIVEDAQYNPFPAGGNFGFEISYAVDGNLQKASYLAQGESYRHIWDHRFDEDVVIHGYVREPVVEGDYYARSYQVFAYLYPQRFQLIGVFATSGVLLLLLLAYLLAAAGRRSGREGYVLGFQDRIPLDVYLPVAGVAMVLPLAFAYELIAYGDIAEGLSLAVAGVLVLAAGCVGVAVLMSLAARYKVGAWWRNTLVYRILRPVGGAAATVVGSVPLIWKAVLGYGMVVVADLFLLYMAFREWAEILLLFYFALHFALFLALGLFVLGLRRLEQAGKQLASGDLEFRVDTNLPFVDLRRHAQHLNSISEGMAAAVAERTRSERLKTELITNVSHDIKTPLTSIINYVDLLGKQPLDGEARDYIQVLERQAARLKKLTEDLVEASKATTGNLEVNLARTDLCELVTQAAGEYEERLGQTRLEPVLATPQDSVQVTADGRHLWRIMDNLLTNVCKYALPGSRVYLEASEQQGYGCVTVKNISAAQLGMDPQDLMERFVRGDDSRAGEGSGLGLHIARSLAELQGGQLEILIDGDLFKVTVRLPLFQRLSPEETTPVFYGEGAVDIPVEGAPQPAGVTEETRWPHDKARLRFTGRLTALWDRTAGKQIRRLPFGTKRQ